MSDDAPTGQRRPFLLSETEALALVLWFDEAELDGPQYAVEYALRDRLRRFALGKRTEPAKPCRW